MAASSSDEDEEIRRFRERLVRGEQTDSSDDGDDETLDFDALSRYAASTSPNAQMDGKDDATNPDWACEVGEVSEIRPGMFLLANPNHFCDADWKRNSNSDKEGEGGQRQQQMPWIRSKGGPSTSLLSKFGLTLPPPSELGPDRQADLLPVLLILSHDPSIVGGSTAVLVNRRTGYLLGDLESDDGAGPLAGLSPFMIQPLWFGGTSGGSGMTVVHQCEGVEGSEKITEDGIYFGGDVGSVGTLLSEGDAGSGFSSFNFKFFVQNTRWLPLQLDKEVRNGTWIAASVGKNVLFKPRDRNGVKPNKPLWTEIMELLEGENSKIKLDLYGKSKEEINRGAGWQEEEILGEEEDIGEFQ
eukprot:CAMPEP_0113314484 /NCGR_PEP_ID=MMETSP0010_2-20120614/10525_1 /TAXON_ID=216773 ORGANISM="Corethron hystrix, Strain 308" /NCGR_SAMPLE_ID=MMETSP0010_2 /ASSEMBLY_ACC=CAM_ASM_000155 /LENGTH=355 /DNA_ID=CAMNT_0000170777 /DNA_START=353 /DNA_END=1423 /DNA_ORIENTATION=- /assembly_acc=CAM_ASM_000155